MSFLCFVIVHHSWLVHRRFNHSLLFLIVVRFLTHFVRYHKFSFHTTCEFDPLGKFTSVGWHEFHVLPQNGHRTLARVRWRTLPVNSDTSKNPGKRNGCVFRLHNGISNTSMSCILHNATLCRMVIAASGVGTSIIRIFPLLGFEDEGHSGNVAEYRRSIALPWRPDFCRNVVTS